MFSSFSLLRRFNEALPRTSVSLFPNRNCFLTFVDDLGISRLQVFRRHLDASVVVLDLLDGRVEANVQVAAQGDRHAGVAVEH